MAMQLQQSMFVRQTLSNVGGYIAQSNTTRPETQNQPFIQTNPHFNQEVHGHRFVSQNPNHTVNQGPPTNIPSYSNQHYQHQYNQEIPHHTHANQLYYQNQPDANYVASMNNPQPVYTQSNIITQPPPSYSQQSRMSTSIQQSHQQPQGPYTPSQPGYVSNPPQYEAQHNIQPMPDEPNTNIKYYSQENQIDQVGVTQSTKYATAHGPTNITNDNETKWQDKRGIQHNRNTGTNKSNDLRSAI
ncbi:uncharacterized protein [Mytilus edulis]|uniref:uncharacterized protein n=1 Tax=Mytilus edulis TaxID=6550 RepID=UPI0039EF61A5